MKNGDMPAMPYIGKEFHGGDSSGYREVDVEHPGITKREYFAAVAMQGIQASNIENEHQNPGSIKWVAELAVKQADALLEELEKRQ